MKRLPAALITQAAFIPALYAAVAAAFLLLPGQPLALRYAAVLPLCYLAGSISWGYVLLRWRMGLDVRDYGSGRIGMANVLRTGGGKAAAAVLALDISKGALAVALAKVVIGEPQAEAAAALAALAGHNWPVFLSFRGGRGILTALGGLALMIPAAAVIATAVWLLVAFWSRYISLGSVVGVAVGAVAVFGLALAGVHSPAYLGFALVAAPVIIWQHRDNIQRIRAGTERRMGQAATRIPN